MKGFLTLVLAAGITAAYFLLPAESRPTPTGTTVKPHHFSEPGVAYTTDYVALHLPAGVCGVAPGTRLIECPDVRVPGKEVVSNGVYTFAVEPQMLTHDIDLAHDLAAADEQDQGRAVSSLARSQEQRAANAYNANLLNAQDVEQINAASVAASTVGNYSSALHSPPVAAVGAAYGGSYGGGGNTYYNGGTTINSVTINQYGSGAGTRGSAGTAGAMSNTARTAAPRTAPTRVMAGAAGGTLNAVGSQ